MARLPDDVIGIGLYAPSEAARYAGVSPQKFSRWVFGTSSAKPVIEPQLGRNGERVVTFLDLAQSLSVNDVRTNIAVPLQKIRDAYIRAKTMHKVEYPFAMDGGIFAFGDLKTKESQKRCELGVFVPKAGFGPKTQEEFREAVCVQLTGKKRDNLLMHPIIKKFSRRLVFGADGLATEYEVFNKYGHRILIDPNIRFGQPYLEHLGAEAFTLSNAARVEGSPERAARLYRVPLSAVRAAVEYISSLGSPHPSKHAA